MTIGKSPPAPTVAGAPATATAVAAAGVPTRPSKPPINSESGPPFWFGARVTVACTAGTSYSPGASVVGSSPAGTPVTFQ
ncbi:Uncharacterised protein [Burkholderia pseudomallei]|nr:Uncharacterised protein [Burkholderia pseudomallei]